MPRRIFRGSLLFGLALAILPAPSAQAQIQTAFQDSPRLVIQTPGTTLTEPVINPAPAERIPASLVQRIYDEIETISAVVDHQKDRAGGGRALAIQFRDSFLPTWKSVMLEKLEKRDLPEATVFIEIFDREVTAHFDDLLASRTDKELDEIFFDDTEIRGLPAVFAEVGDDFELALKRNTATDGTVSATAHPVDVLWDWGITIVDCIVGSSGPGALAAKLAEVAHTYVHRNTTVSAEATVTATEAHKTLDVLAEYAWAIEEGAVSTTGGRDVIRAARDELFPHYTAKLRAELTEQGKTELLPALDQIEEVAQAEFAKLEAMSDEELNGRIYGGQVVFLAEALLESETGLHAAIDRDVAQTSTGVGDDLVGFIWSAAEGLVDCIPNVGEILSKIVGMVHQNAHGFAPVPGGDPVLVALDEAAREIVALEGTPGRGRALVEFVRDKSVEMLQSKLTEKSRDMGRTEYLAVIEMGVERQLGKMNSVLASHSDAELDRLMFDAKADVRVWAEIFASLNLADPAVAHVPDPETVWGQLVSLIECMTDADDPKIAAALQEVHDWLH